MTSPSDEIVFVIAVPYDAEFFNDIYRNFTGTGGYFVCNNVFSRLVVLDVLDSKGAYPDLAQTWEVSDDAREYRFYLRQGVKWHDGEPFTSEDVKYTYDTVIANRYSGAAWLAGVSAIRTPDPFVVEMTLNEPNAGFLAQLGIFIMTMVLPKHLYSGTDWATNPHNWDPIGTGPFRFDHWDRGREIHLVANPDYFLGRPAVDRVIIRVIPDRHDAFAAVLRGDAHFAVHSPPCDMVKEFLANPDLGVLMRPGHSLAYLGFNMRRSPWNDRRVRTAVAQAIDRVALERAVCPYAYHADGAYLPSHPWAFDPSAKMPARDVQAAAEALAQAGLTASSGRREPFIMVHQAVFQYMRHLSAAVASQLATVGLDVEIRALDSVEWRTSVSEAHDFDLMVGTGDIGPDPQLYAAFLTSGSLRNELGYTNSEVDALFAAARSTFDIERRRRYFFDVQRILCEDLPRITLMQHGTHSPYSRSFVGWPWDLGVRGMSPFYGYAHLRPATGKSLKRT